MDAVTLSSSSGLPVSAATAPKPSRFRINGYVGIWSLATALALVTAAECHSITHIPSLLYGIVLWGWWGCVGTVLWKLGQREPAILGFSAFSIAAHVTIGGLLGVVHLILLGSPLAGADPKTPISDWMGLLHINRLGLELLLYGFLLGITGIIQAQIRSHQENVKSLELQRQLSAAQLRALQMQLEPHFLFNTLNAITTLVELGRQSEATEMLGHLNALLKSTLKRTTPEKVPLYQELEIVENYLAIEQVRFADRLRIEIKAEPGTLDSLVPCFLLQPIVENAIRHGIAHCESNGLVEASARRDGDRLHIEVRDTGSRSNGRAGGHAKPGNGIGLTNTRERLAHFYNNDYDMNAQPIASGGYSVAIAIPYERTE
jgi:signal transduction histidine kinase